MASRVPFRLVEIGVVWRHLSTEALLVSALATHGGTAAGGPMPGKGRCRRLDRKRASVATKEMDGVA